MRYLLLVLPALALACRKPCPACATLPVRPVSEPVVVQVAPRAKCALPDLPQPIPFVGFPSPDGQQIYVSTTDMKALAVYLAEMRGWITSAAVCLER
jgi:hypothetical protein